MIIEAGYAAAQEHGQAMTVAHVLSRARLSTRSFYRHFCSKDELVRELMRRDTAAAAVHLARRMGAARCPEEAVGIWIRSFFRFVSWPLDPTGRPDLTASVGVYRLVVPNEDVVASRRALLEPLRAAVAEGVASGCFDTTIDVDSVTTMMLSSVLDAVGLNYGVQGTSTDPQPITRMWLRALGAPAEQRPLATATGTTTIE